jgi:O-methyltransferase|tara:strand:- start:14775 stop:15440 length:666 start_codon:yes stop_codon:yes gene_type:complete
MTEYKIQFFDAKTHECVGEQTVDDNFVKIVKDTGFVNKSLKAHITCCFIYTLKDKLPEGSMAELGVYRGGVTKFLATLFPNRTVYAFDTFEGIPKSVLTLSDNMSGGEFSDVEDVFEYLNDPNIVIGRGLFPSTIDSAIAKDVPFALVHLDADLYWSTLEGLRYFWPRMANGGIVILDDFEEQPTTPGVKKAFYDYFKDVLVPDIYPVLKDSGVVAIRKTT